MTKLRLTAFCWAILTLAGCSQQATNPANAVPDKAGTAQTQPPASNPFPDSRGGSDGGGGGY